MPTKSSRSRVNEQGRQAPTRAAVLSPRNEKAAFDDSKLVDGDKVASTWSTNSRRERRHDMQSTKDGKYRPRSPYVVTKAIKT